MTEIGSTNDDTRLTAALKALRSGDVLTQNQGVEGAIQIGGPAVPELLSLAGEPNANRAQIMYALSQVGDARAEREFLSGLQDDDERVRAYAAQGLVRIGHANAMAACLQTLNDAADELHLDRTPSVAALGDMGLSAVPPLLDLLMHPDELTRLRSQRALEMILSRRHQLRLDENACAEAVVQKTCDEWRALGDYDYRADAQVRAESVALWRQWLARTANAGLSGGGKANAGINLATDWGLAP